MSRILESLVAELKRAAAKINFFPLNWFVQRYFCRRLVHEEIAPVIAGLLLKRINGHLRCDIVQ
jgi:hypothetical protein